MRVNGHEIKPWANLSKSDLSVADLVEANLFEANLVKANLSGADLVEANLSGADLSGADLSWANLIRANLVEANLRGANLGWANLHGADLRGAKGIIDGGQDSRGYRFFAVRQGNGIMIGAGCRWFTPKEALAHWAKVGRSTNPESLARAMALLEVARCRGWEAETG